MGDNEIEKVRARVHRRTLEARAFERVVYSQEFEDVYKPGPEIEEILKSGDIDRLKIWIKNETPIVLGTMSYRELRDLAKKHNVPRWSRLDTYELMEELEKIPAVKEKFG